MHGYDYIQPSLYPHAKTGAGDDGCLFHIGVGSCVARSTTMGNARASVRGTSDRSVPTLFYAVTFFLITACKGNCKHKRRNAMAILRSITTAVLTVTLFITCSPPTYTYEQAARGNDLLPPIYNDSIDSIISGAGKIILYDMDDFTTDGNNKHTCNSLSGYPIKRRMGKLCNEAATLLKFITTDHSMNVKDYSPIRQPFNPNIGFEFRLRKAAVFMLVSFGTHEIAITDTCRQFKFYRMRSIRPLARWAYMMFPEYKEYYLNLLKDQPL